MKQRVILSTKLVLGAGTFEVETLTEAQALAWLATGPVENYCGHATVRILGLDPASVRGQCASYDEALAINAKKRLEFGREYSLEEIKAIGVEFTLIRRVVSLGDILALAAQLPSGLNDSEAADKLVRERQELLQALAEGDQVGALTEAADAAYYAAKHLDYVAQLLDLSVDDVLSLTRAKYTLRARAGNPKDDAAERAAVRAEVINES